MGYNTVTVTVTPYVEPIIALDPSRVCILINGTANVNLFAINSYNYESQLESAIADSSDLALAKEACTAFFSVSNGKKDAVFAVYKDDLDVFNTTDEDLLPRWIVLHGMRSEWENFDAILTRTTSNTQFLCVNEESGVAPASPTDRDYLIQISNPTQIILPVISFLTANLSSDPGFDCSTTITGSTITGSNYSTAIYNSLVAAGCNFYTSVGGVMGLEAGVVNAKTKIERVYFRDFYLPNFLIKQIASFRASYKIKESDTQIVYEFFSSLLMNLYNSGYLKKSSLLDNEPFVIENIEVVTDESGVKKMVVYFKYSFNNNIDMYTINVGEVA